MSRDVLALILSYAYVLLVIGLGEGLRRWRGYSDASARDKIRPPSQVRDERADASSVDFTRKVIHIGVGMWAFGTALLFQSWTYAVIPPLSFVVINYFSYRYGAIKAMELGERGNLGTVYFPISFAALIPVLWHRPALLVAALMPMAWGDAFAAIVGERWGRRAYAFLGQRRTLEGTAAMFVFSVVWVWIALVTLSDVGPGRSLGYALLTGAFAAAVEALTPFHLDNLTVPLLSAGLLAWVF